MRLPANALVSLCAFFIACSIPRVTTHSVGQAPPICTPGPLTGHSLILWGASWRSNQKEPEKRRQIAEKAIAQFFQQSKCVKAKAILESIDGQQALGLSDDDMLQAALRQSADRVIQIRVEELGPLLIVHPSPILWEGGSETQLRIRIIELPSGKLRSDISIHRRDTGAFVLRGTGALDNDLIAGLEEIFGSP